MKSTRANFLDLPSFLAHLFYSSFVLDLGKEGEEHAVYVFGLDGDELNFIHGSNILRRAAVAAVGLSISSLDNYCFTRHEAGGHLELINPDEAEEMLNLGTYLQFLSTASRSFSGDF